MELSTCKLDNCENHQITAKKKKTDSDDRNFQSNYQIENNFYLLKLVSASLINL
jgi:hypothetical protein